MVEDTYLKAVRLAKALQEHLERGLREALAGLGDPFLVRAQVVPSRIKSEISLKEKAGERAWTLEDAISRAGDFVGFRIVCNNIQDVRRAVALITEKLEKDGLDVKVRDYIKSPLKDGYRACHLLFRSEVALGKESMEFGCEIQIRTCLQDSWGKLSHTDIYKSKPPATLVHKMERLSSLLARADRIAEEIRCQVVRPQRGRRPSVGAALTTSAIAFIYRTRFGENPPEYLVRSILRDYGSTSLRADGLDTLLNDEGFVNKIEERYLEQTRWKPQKEEIFRWAVKAAAEGTASAVAEARRDGRESWREVDRIYKGEIASSIPDDLADAENALQRHHKDDDPAEEASLWAEYFDATSECCYCSTQVVRVSDLAWRMAKHFKLRGERADEAYGRLCGLLAHCGIEDADATGACNRCNYTLGKDD
jgi:ppGpp synthetase/RelA/SpoT-type nucleotidyltranferase